MGPLIVVVVFVVTQIALRRLVFRPMLRGKLSPTTAAILTGAAWASLPILASTVGGAEWSPEVIAGGFLVQFVSVALFVRVVVPVLFPPTLPRADHPSDDVSRAGKR